MSREKRDNVELTQTLVGFFVTPTEKALIKEAKPEDLSMSRYIRDIVLPEVLRYLTKENKIDELTTQR